MMRVLTTAIIGLIVTSVTGCSPPGRAVSFSGWQENIEQYVREEANGDPNVLRDVTVASGHRGYAMLGNDRIDLSTDASGVLLGRRQIEDKAYFVYLVAMHENGQLKSIRLTGFTISGARFAWVAGPINPQATAAYQRFVATTWKKIHPTAEKSPPLYQTFPLGEDRFKLSVDGHRIIATHEQSGAQWEMAIGS